MAVSCCKACAKEAPNGNFLVGVVVVVAFGVAVVAGAVGIVGVVIVVVG